MRKLALMAVSFSFGIFITQYIVPAEWWGYLSIFAAIVLLFAVILHGPWRTRCLLIAVGIALSVGWSVFYSAVIFSPTESYAEKEIHTQAVAIDYAEKTDYGVKVKIRVRPENSAAVKAWLYYTGIEPEHSLQIEPGDILDFTAEFRLADQMAGEDTDYYMSNGIFLTAYAKGDLKVVGKDGTGIRYFPTRLARQINDLFKKFFDTETYPFISALLLGKRDALQKDQAFVYALTTSGAYHVVAVSGMHVSFLVGFVNLLIRRRKIAAFVTVPILLLFTAITGFSPSIVRAGIMCLFVIGATIFEREEDTLTSLTLALMILLIWNPFSIKNVGLQLSFASTLGICLYSGKIRAFFEKRIAGRSFSKKSVIKPVLHFVTSAISSTLGAMVFSVPLSALYFGYFSLAAPLTNILIMPVLSLVFLGSAVFCCFGALFPWVGHAGGFLMGLPTKYIIWIVRKIANWQFSSLSMLNGMNLYWLIFVYVLLVTFLMFKKEKHRAAMVTGLMAVGLCTVLLLNTFSAAQEKMLVTAVDVGQGQSIVIASGDAVAVVDCGNTNGYGAAQNTADYIRSSGRNGIDVLILTHYHTDHAGNVCELMEICDVGTMVLPEPGEKDEKIYREIVQLAAQKEIPICTVNDLCRIHLNDVDMQLFPPFNDRSGDGNERCISLLSSCNNYDMLITGDMSAAGEKRLIREYDLPDIELLIVGHHGSKNASDAAFLETIRPEYAIVSVGHNSFGHPTDEALKRLDACGADVYRTDINGNITFAVRES